MDPLVTSTLVSTGADLLGGLFGGKSSATKAYDMAKEQAWIGVENQKYIDENRIGWLKKAAEQNQISPLVALGMQPVSGPTVSMGPVEKSGFDASSLGQNLGRAAEAILTKDQRVQQKLMDGLALERASLENDLLRSQISNISKPTNPPVPSSVKPMTVMEALTNKNTADRERSRDDKVIPEFTTLMTDRGPVRITSPEYAQIMESDWAEMPRAWIRQFTNMFRDAADATVNYIRKTPHAPWR